MCVYVFVCVMSSPFEEDDLRRILKGQCFNTTVFTIVYFSGLKKTNSKNIFHNRVIMSLPLELWMVTCKLSLKGGVQKHLKK